MTRLNLEASRKYFDPRTLAKLHGLRLRARHIVEGYVAGLHRSPLRGFSIEFAEHREYAPGDDLRHVDWKVFGRTDKFYLKQYEDETNLVCYLVLDNSESMAYQSDDAAMSKLDYARCLAATLAWLVIQQQDAVGLALFDSELRTVVRPASNPTHLTQLIEVMESLPHDDTTNMGRVFHELAERLPRRGLVIILSDCFDDVSTLLSGLQHLRHRRHDVILLHVLDPAEIEFPFRRTTLFKGLERQPEVLTDPRSLQKAYLAEFHQFLTEVELGCRARQIDRLLLRTDQRFDYPLSAFLSRRMAKSD